MTPTARVTLTSKYPSMKTVIILGLTPFADNSARSILKYKYGNIR